MGCAVGAVSVAQILDFLQVIFEGAESLGSTKELLELKLVTLNEGTIKHELLEGGGIQLAGEIGQCYISDRMSTIQDARRNRNNIRFKPCCWGTSARTLHPPLAACCSLERSQLRKSLAAAGCSAVLKMAARWGQMMM